MIPPVKFSFFTMLVVFELLNLKLKMNWMHLSLSVFFLFFFAVGDGVGFLAFVCD